MAAPTDPDLYILTREDGRKVYHLGSLGPIPKDTDPTKAHHLPAYTENGFALPGHWWNARWTDRTNCPIQIKRSPAQIVAANRMFPYGDTGAKLPAVDPRKPYTPMGSAWITTYMPTTGERPDIGLITDASADFMLGRNSASMIDAALAAESCPMHFRDEATERPIDLTKYTRANAYDLPGYQGSPWLCKGPKMPNGYTAYGGNWTPQQAHFCEMSYMAYLATGDLGFLEELQYSANFTVLSDAARSTSVAAIVSGETRGIAWALRNLFMAHVATQDLEATAKPFPTWLHPSSYFKKLLDNALGFYGPMMNNPREQTFRLIGEFNRFSPWTVDYLLTSLAFGVLTGHSDWAPLYLWCLGNCIGRTNGTSGYPPGLGTSYRLNTIAGGQAYTWRQAFDALVGDPEVQLTQAQHDALIANPMNNGNAMLGAEYMMTTRAVLVQAKYLDGNGLANVSAIYPELDICLANADRMARRNAMNPRQSVVLDASAAPAVIVPLPTPQPVPAPAPVPTTPKPQPSPGVPKMKTFAELAADVHAQSTVIDGAVNVIANIVARLKAMADAAAGNSIDPAAIDALAKEIEAHTTALGSAIANVPAGS